MKKKDLIKIREESIDKAKKRLEELQKRRLEAGARIALGKEVNLKQVKNLRRDIAQLLTIIHEKEKKIEE